METNKIDKISLEQLTTRLQKEDKSYARLSKVIMILYLVLIPFYIYVTTMEYIETREVNVIIWGGAIIAAFVVFALLFKSFYREYNFVNYAEPTLVMLKKAAYRYKAFNRKSIWALVALILMDISFTAHFIQKWTIVKIQLFFLGLIALGVIIGIILWHVKYRPIRINALRLIKELEETE